MKKSGSKPKEQRMSPTSGETIRREFIYRRQIALKCGFREVTGRLIGFVEWMKSVPLLMRLLREVGDQANAEHLMFYAYDQGPLRYRRDEIDARTIEQIAGVGLALIERADKKKQPLYDVGHDFGIYSAKYDPSADSDAVVTRYVIPFLDYLEQRLPEGPKSVKSVEVAAPAVIFDSLKMFCAQHRRVGGRCFIMMRFGETAAHERIEAAIKGALGKHGLVGMLARDKEFHEDLFPNILTYMHGCDFGIAVFERLETEVFNPNVALEVGYMLGLRKPVLLLKDRTLVALHTDLIGKLYREFDPQKPKATIPKEIGTWLTDKGLA